MKKPYRYLSALAIVASSSASCSITGVQTDKAPQAIGPYSQAVRGGDYLFISGQLGMDPSSGVMAGDTVTEQTAQAINNIEAILKEAGLTLQDVVKAEVYLKHMDDFQSMNAVYTEKFSHAVKPARQAMQVSKLPRDALVEISCIAFISN